MYFRSGISNKLLLNFFLISCCIFYFSSCREKKIIQVNFNSTNTQTIFLKKEDAVLNVQALNPKYYIKKPIPLDYDNFKYCNQQNTKCTQPIKYNIKHLKKLDGKNKIHITEIINPLSYGTYIIIIKTKNKEKELEAVIRKDDSYTGYLTELINVPFLYYPKNTNKGHQTDLRIGADCIALVIYGKRREGFNIPYFAPSAIYNYTIKIGEKENIKQTKIKPGDILHFGFQTAVIYKDENNDNLLNNEDLIIHTYHKFGEIIKFKNLPYKNSDFDILRWNL